MRGKRFLSLILAVLLIVTLVPIPAQAAKGDKLVALTFDDGPHKTYTKQLLDGLKSRGANVTFFMVGQNAASNLDLVQRAYDEGHEVANHTYSHPNLSNLSSGSVKTQLNNTISVLNKACGSGTEYLVRPPYGSASSSTLAALGAPAIIWSVDTNDWKYRNTNHVYNHIVNNASDGAIILCHDIHATTIPAVLKAIDTLQAKGYEFVTVSELYRRRGVSMSDGVKYFSCKNTGVDYGPVEKPVITYEPDNGGVRVTITSPSGAPVYYTVDGSRVTQQSTKYSGSFVVQCPAEIKAVAAYDLNGDRSATVTSKITLPPCATPELSIENNVLTLTCSTSGMPIYYTLDGTKATTSSTVYTGPVAIEPGTTVRAVAGGGTHMVSSELMLHYSENGNLFADVFPNEWYYSSIDRLATLGLMSGVGGNSFAPNIDTSRAMIVSMLYRYSGDTLESGWKRTNTFKDVADGMWYSEAVEWAYRKGIVAGYPNGNFGHSDSITRQEMARVFAGFLEYRDNALEFGPDCRAAFGDGSMIPDWALESVNAIVAAGLMVGDGNGNFNPAKTASRAECAAVLSRMIDLEAKMEAEKEDTSEEDSLQPGDGNNVVDIPDEESGENPVDSENPTETEDSTKTEDSTEPKDPIETENPTDAETPEADDAGAES